MSLQNLDAEQMTILRDLVACAVEATDAPAARDYLAELERKAARWDYCLKHPETLPTLRWRYGENEAALLANLDMLIDSEKV